MTQFQSHPIGGVQVNSTRGFTLVEVFIMVIICMVIAAIAIPQMLTSRCGRGSNLTKAIGALKAINTAQATYRRKNSMYADSFEALVIDGGLDTGIESSCSDYSGYKIFIIHPIPGQEDKWYYGVGATPTVPGDSGDMSFCTNAKSTVWMQELGGTVEQSANLEYPARGEDGTANWSIAGQ